jgi:hypothetical protein
MRHLILWECMKKDTKVTPMKSSEDLTKKRPKGIKVNPQKPPVLFQKLKVNYLLRLKK